MKRDNMESMSPWLKLLLQTEATDLRAGVGVGVESSSLFPDKRHLICVSDVSKEVGREINAEARERELIFIKYLLCTGFFPYLSHLIFTVDLRHRF